MHINHINAILCARLTIQPVSNMTMLCYNYLLSTASFENTAAATTSTKIGDQSDMSNKSMHS